MHSSLALLLYIIITLYLLWLDYKRHSKVSNAIWVPLIWLLLMGSQPISQWLDLNSGLQSVEEYMEGSPSDRALSLFLIGSGVVILLSRNIDWNRFFKQNTFLILFFLYGAASIVWSDFPFVALKRWIKGVGNLTMVIIVLTETRPDLAIEALLRRCTYILIPLSIVFIKYYPELGRYYDRWTGEVSYSGVTYGKNALGYLCLVCGYYFLWSFLSKWQEKGFKNNRTELGLHLLFLTLIIWLLVKANSVTSITCTIIGGSILVFTGLKFAKRNINLLTVYLSLAAVLAAAVVLLTDVNQYIFMKAGRDATLTGRTDLWVELLQTPVNRLIGAGYESFWLGARALYFWQKHWWRPTQAHNGFLELYLNLGLLGIIFLAMMIYHVYAKICRGMAMEYELSRFRLGFLIITLTYNLTEAAFKGLHIIWFIFLLIAIDYSIANRNKPV